MKPDTHYPELIQHLTQFNQLTPQQADRLVEEVIAYFNESVEQFVQRRHRQLQENGYKNSEIFTTIEAELPTQRFPAPNLTLRQMRRLVYG